MVEIKIASEPYGQNSNKGIKLIQASFTYSILVMVIRDISVYIILAIVIRDISDIS